MSLIDNLKPGMFAVITPKSGGDIEYAMNQWGMPDQGRMPVKPTGACCEIVAINLPLIVIDGTAGRKLIDSKDYDFQIVDKSFALSLMVDLSKQANQPKKRRRPKPDDRTCHRCGGRLCQLLKPGLGWYKYCRECGWGGEPVPSGKE